MFSTSHFIFLYLLKKNLKSQILRTYYFSSYIIPTKRKKLFHLVCLFIFFKRSFILILVESCSLVWFFFYSIFLKKRKEKKELDTSNCSLWRLILHIAKSRGCRKCEKELANLWHEGERNFVWFFLNLYLFKILLDLGFLFIFIMCDGRSWEKNPTGNGFCLVKCGLQRIRNFPSFMFIHQIDCHL